MLYFLKHRGFLSLSSLRDFGCFLPFLFLIFLILSSNWYTMSFGGILGQSEAAVTRRELISSSKDKTSAKWDYLLVLETIFGLPILAFLRILASFGGQRIFHSSPVPPSTSSPGQCKMHICPENRYGFKIPAMMKIMPSISNKSRKFMLPLELGRRNPLHVPCLCLWLL